MSLVFNPAAPRLANKGNVLAWARRCRSVLGTQGAQGAQGSPSLLGRLNLDPHRDSVELSGRPDLALRVEARVPMETFFFSHLSPCDCEESKILQKTRSRVTVLLPPQHAAMFLHDPSDRGVHSPYWLAPWLGGGRRRLHASLRNSPAVDRRFIFRYHPDIITATCAVEG